MKQIAEQRMLVVGAGSIGQRHTRNLHQLGARQLAVCDPEQQRLTALVAEYGALPFASLDQALALFQPEIVLICTPPLLHVEQAIRAVQAGAHVFIEKPLAATLDGVDQLIALAEERGCVAQVGYNLRFHPGVQQLKRLLGEDAIGRVLCGHAEFGQYLPDWRPQQDYRQSYTAQQRQGGGVILDVSHELDYVLWLLGGPRDVQCVAGNLSDLAMDAEDCATMLLRFAAGPHMTVHLDCVQRSYTRTCKLVGTQGTIVWDYAAQQVQVYRAAAGCWETLPYTHGSNDMYMAEMQHFLECVARKCPPLVGLREAKAVLQVALAAKSAAATDTVQVLG